MTTNPAPDEDGSAAAVTAGLRALSHTYPQLPSPVAERLDRALADLPDLSAPDTAPRPAPPVKRPWWRRGYALASASLVVVAFVAGGLLFAAQPWQSGSQGSGTAQEKSDTQAEPFEERDSDKDGAPGQEPSIGAEAEDYAVTYSGRDYRQSDLTDARDVSAAGDKSAVPSELTPLSGDETRRDLCVAGVNRTFDGSVKSVDFGRYEGEPAMIAVLAAGSGGVVAAVGPQCGASDTQVLGSVTY